jgi:iron complex outermembrane receptor protein
MRGRFCAYGFFVALLLCPGAIASEITGQVSDPSGASVPRARIAVSGNGGAKPLATATDENGRFALSGLAPGKYVVRIESDRFETANVDVEIREDASIPPLSISLKLKQVSEQVTVRALSESLTLPSATVAQERLETFPGNVSEIPADAFRGGAMTSMDDALSLTPGVFAQPKGGSEEVRLSIRGSGMNVPFGSRGIQILRNGIPLTRADGFSNPEPADVTNAEYIEVYRGADALEFGAASLGGAINIVSPTGHSQPGPDVRTEFGSFGYRRGQIRYGAVADSGRLDTFVSASGILSDGFRQNSKETTYRFAGNLGYRFTARSEGRLFFDYQRMDIRRPDAITLAQLETDPFVAGPGAVRSNTLIDLNPSMQIAYQHTLLLGNADRISFDAHYLKTDFDNPYAFAHSRGADRDYGVALRHEVNRALWSHKNRFVWGGGWIRGHGDGTTGGPVYFGNFLAEPNTGPLQATHNRRTSAEFLLQDSFSVTSTFSVIAGGQFAYALRDLVATTPAPPTFFPIFFPNAASRTYTAVNPKLGLLWAPRQKVQIFANVSRSFEPPDDFEFSPSSSLANLDAQRGTTAEVGARGGSTSFGWDLAAYSGWIKKEIFSIQSPPNSGQFVTFNRDRTRHSGVEAALHGRLPLRLAAGSINWNLAYTWNLFRFAHDPDFGNNRLPIVPKHSARLDLTWHHPSGIYVGPSFQIASDLFVDLANTLKAPGYAVAGATLGYSREGRYRVFLDLRNIGNRYYAASTEYIVDAGRKDAAAFNPGLTRAVFGGVEVKLW